MLPDDPCLQDSAEHVWILAQTHAAARGKRLETLVLCLMFPGSCSKFWESSGNPQLQGDDFTLFHYISSNYRKVISAMVSKMPRFSPHPGADVALPDLCLVFRAWKLQSRTSQAGWEIAPVATWVSTVNMVMGCYDNIWLWEVMGMHISMQLYTPCSDQPRGLRILRREEWYSMEWSLVTSLMMLWWWVKVMKGADSGKSDSSPKDVVTKLYMPLYTYTSLYCQL